MKLATKYNLSFYVTISKENVMVLSIQLIDENARNQTFSLDIISGLKLPTLLTLPALLQGQIDTSKIVQAEIDGFQPRITTRNFFFVQNLQNID